MHMTCSCQLDGNRASASSPSIPVSSRLRIQVCLYLLSIAAERKCIPEWWWCVSSQTRCVPWHAVAANYSTTSKAACHDSMDPHTHTYLDAQTVNKATHTRLFVLCKHVCVCTLFLIVILNYINLLLGLYCKQKYKLKRGWRQRTEFS